jgi:hypothetical protein
MVEYSENGVVEGVGVADVLSLKEDWDGDGNEGGEECPGARTTHFPSVWTSATRRTLRPHCSRITRNFGASIKPFGTSNARTVRVDVTAKLKLSSSAFDDGGCSGSVGPVESVEAELEERDERRAVMVDGEEDEDEMRSSVAPTLQWFGYTGTLYASTSLYSPEVSRESTSDAGRKELKLLRVCSSFGFNRGAVDRLEEVVEADTVYSETENEVERATTSG